MKIIMSQKKHAAMAENKESLNSEWHEAIMRIDIFINPINATIMRRELDVDLYTINEQKSAIILLLT